MLVKQELLREGKVIYRFTEKIDKWNGSDTQGLKYLRKQLKEARDIERKSIDRSFYLFTFTDNILISEKEIKLRFNQGDKFSLFSGYVL